jgi:arginine decarboxylase
MIPGHSGGLWNKTSRIAQFFGTDLLSLDVPQLLSGVDLEPDSPFSKARDLAAQAWAVKRTWFLTNGASQGNRMALMALRACGEGIVVQRSSHSSLFDGLTMSGLAPTFVLPTFDYLHGIAHGVTAESVDTTLATLEAAGARPAAVAIVSPSYFGTVADVAAIADVSHGYGVPLVVDASWGAHFGFHDTLPPSPTVQGADIVITSTHKLGGSLTQSAMLHLCDGAYADELEPLLERAFRLTESTSPSSLLLASLDIARSQLASEVDGIDQSVRAAAQLRQMVEAHPILSLTDEHFRSLAGVADIDPLHITIDIRALAQSGSDVRAALARDHGVFVEIATQTAIVALIAPFQPADPAVIVGALGEMGRGSPHVSTALTFDTVPPDAGISVMTPREAYLASTEWVATSKSVGRVSADMLAAYPPGVPNVVPGETITAEAITFLHEALHSPGGYVRGLSDPTMKQLRVIK